MGKEGQWKEKRERTPRDYNCSHAESQLTRARGAYPNHMVCGVISRSTWNESKNLASIRVVFLARAPKFGSKQCLSYSVAWYSSCFCTSLSPPASLRIPMATNKRKKEGKSVWISMHGKRRSVLTNFSWIEGANKWKEEEDDRKRMKFVKIIIDMEIRSHFTPKNKKN